MRALTIKQPWASLIVHGTKRIENRTWPTRYRGRILIHASKRGYDSSGDRLCKELKLELPTDRPQGVILGEAMLVDCVQLPAIGFHEFGPWAFGPWAWVLENVVDYSEPIACRGALGLWKVPSDLSAEFQRLGIRWDAPDPQIENPLLYGPKLPF